MTIKKNACLMLLFLTSLLVMSCKDDDCTTCSDPVGGDSLVIGESFVTNGIHPSISPDGMKLAFSINGDIYVCDTNGMNPKQLTSGKDYDILPKWNPDGLSIGFVRRDSGVLNSGKLYSVGRDGSNIHALYIASVVADSLLLYRFVTAPIWDWSSTGKHIAFLSMENKKTVLNIIGLESNVLLKSVVLDNVSIFNYSGFAFSPSGNKILFIKSDSSQYKFYLYQYNLISNSETQMLSNLSVFIFPSWSNMENMYSFVTDDGLKVIQDDSVVIKSYTYSGASGKFSPDGRWFVYENTSKISGPLGYDFSRLRIIDLVNNKPYWLTADGDIDKFNYFFVWHPSSKYIFSERKNRIYKSELRIDK